MKIVMAIDSFKGSLSSMDAGRAAAEGIQRVDPKVQVKVRPLADGGEGTVEALTEGMGVLEILWIVSMEFWMRRRRRSLRCPARQESLWFPGRD